MPYIERNRRVLFDEYLKKLDRALDKAGDDEGDYNYVFSCLLWRMLKRNRRYKTMNKIEGILGLVCFEFKRRFVATYEDGVARPKNGDIDPYWWKDEGSSPHILTDSGVKLPFSETPGDFFDYPKDDDTKV